MITANDNYQLCLLPMIVTTDGGIFQLSILPTMIIFNDGNNQQSKLPMLATNVENYQLWQVPLNIHLLDYYLPNKPINK